MPEEYWHTKPPNTFFPDGKPSADGGAGDGDHVGGDGRHRAHREVGDEAAAVVDREEERGEGEKEQEAGHAVLPLAEHPVFAFGHCFLLLHEGAARAAAAPVGPQAPDRDEDGQRYHAVDDRWTYGFRDRSAVFVVVVVVCWPTRWERRGPASSSGRRRARDQAGALVAQACHCLLYTSDAADE